MKALNATPREVRRIFADSYVIPDFQRPYTWEEEMRALLWKNLNWDTMNIKITNAITYVKTERSIDDKGKKIEVIGPTKSAAGVRVMRLRPSKA